MSAPERIWAWKGDACNDPMFSAEPTEGWPEYLRADIAAATIEGWEQRHGFIAAENDELKAEITRLRYEVKRQQRRLAKRVKRITDAATREAAAYAAGLEAAARWHDRHATQIRFETPDDSPSSEAVELETHIESAAAIRALAEKPQEAPQTGASDWWIADGFTEIGRDASGNRCFVSEPRQPNQSALKMPSSAEVGDTPSEPDIAVQRQHSEPQGVLVEITDAMVERAEAARIAAWPATDRDCMRAALTAALTPEAK